MTSQFDVNPEVVGKLTCGSLSGEDVGQEVKLQGWVDRRRDLGGLIFIDLRDRYGVTQVMLNPEIAFDAHAIASDVRSEYVLEVLGVVRARPLGTVNDRLKTGEIELEAHTVTVLNQSKTPPFYINEDSDVDESLRLKFRYLDLRRARLQNNIITRHRIVKYIRDFLDAKGFIEVETPLLIKSSPEGARDFLVPSSANPGSLYALPQSPQQLKQLLMVAGYDRYFQIARCFRDEAQRADRQPEFTQLDLEMAFVQEDDIMRLIEQLYIELTAAFTDKHVPITPFPRLTYSESMERYGNDRPDTRFGLELQDVSTSFADTEFNAFSHVLESGGQIKLIVVPQCGDFSRREIDELTEIAKSAGAKGLATISMGTDGIKSPIAKFLNESEIEAITAGAGAETGDLILIIADTHAVVAKALSTLRESMASRLGLADPNTFAYCWIYEFPLFEWDDEGQRWDATHNPFSGFLEEDRHLLACNPGAVRAMQYDLTLNGNEIGGGSIRMHKRIDQANIFELMGHSPEAQQERFGAILDALDYGAPPHGGIAMGIDRFAMLASGEASIREVIAFPKNQRGIDLMFDSPAPVEADQLLEVGLQLAQPPVDKAEVH